MTDDNNPVNIARNPRLRLTNAERAAIDSSNRESLTRRSQFVLGDTQRKVRDALKDETRATLVAVTPDFDAKASQLSNRFRAQLNKLKGAPPPGPALHIPVDQTLSSRGRRDGAKWDIPGSLFDKHVFGVTSSYDNVPAGRYWGIVQPANAGEFWWAETDSFVSAPANSLFVDIDNDPCRIFGHIGYNGDPLLSGTIGVSMIFMLTPDRFPFTSRSTFEVRPEIRTGGIVSGWTGFYDWLWAADDKWSKCWRTFRATISLSSGEVLADHALSDTRFFLEDESPVGQANISEFMGWEPILGFEGDLGVWRSRGVTLILRVECHYDFQLEGDSDIWFRRTGGSAQNLSQVSTMHLPFDVFQVVSSLCELPSSQRQEIVQR